MVNIPPFRKTWWGFLDLFFPCSHKTLFFPRRLNWRHHHVNKVSLGVASITNFHQLTDNCGNSKGRQHRSKDQFELNPVNSMRLWSDIQTAYLSKKVGICSRFQIKVTLNNKKHQIWYSCKHRVGSKSSDSSSLGWPKILHFVFLKSVKQWFHVKVQRGSCYAMTIMDALTCAYCDGSFPSKNKQLGYWGTFGNIGSACWQVLFLFHAV